MSYDNTNSGALFKNNDKESERHPDYKGSINIEGVEYWLSAWLKESKKGTKYMSLAAKPKGARQEVKQGRQEDAPFDDDIPW